MDGFTLTLSLTIPVTPGQVNSLRIGIADVADSNYDSNLLIAADSVQGNLVAIDDTQTITLGGTKTVDPLANDINQTGGVLTITHINGIPVVAGDTVTLTTGQSVTLNASGTFTVTTDFDIETINFTYNVDSTTGDSDVGIVTIDTVPCFVAGTTVLTPGGEVPVEQLSPGELVITKDDGAQPVRWTGRRSVHAVGSFSPVLLESGAIGNYRALMVSPQHRVLINSARAELLFGDAEVLVAAGHLTNGRDIHQVEGGTVEYVHILFDRHQIVFSEGVLTESFLPGPQTGNCYEAEVLAELVTLFPELDPTTGLGYGPAARRVLKSFEVRALLSA